MASIARSLRRIKNRSLTLEGVLEPDAAERVFREFGHDWREREISPNIQGFYSEPTFPVDGLIDGCGVAWSSAFAPPSTCWSIH